MERSKSLKRLYVGGLSHTVSQKELQERFSKFGDVTDVEIITRKDEQGVPVKTFGYLNINISELDFHKCLSVLNKTRWKGGTLQVEQAKESFLHRLAMERQEAKEKEQASLKDSRNNTVESLKKVGIVDFHMKAAVPGTEVPNHKDWVVSKYGRVLPILRLREQQKNKIMKYDPSKYCHNIKNLAQAAGQETMTPISQLTWHLEGGDDDISKKRRGEFPDTKTQSDKKLKSLNIVEGINSASKSPVEHSTRKRGLHMQKHMNKVAAYEKNDSTKLGLLNTQLIKNGSKAFEEKMCSSVRRSVNCAESDVDSEEELRLLLEQEGESKHRSYDVSEDCDHLEIVGDNFHLKYDTHWAPRNPKKGSRSATRGDNSDENEYDSADTDEIIAVGKPKDYQSSKTKTATDYEFRVKKKVKSPQSLETKCKDSEGAVKGFSQNIITEENCLHSKSAILRKEKNSKLTNALQSESSNSSISSSESEEISYEAMMRNCVRIDLGLDDLKKLASKSLSSSDEENKELGGHWDSKESCENCECTKISFQSKPLPGKVITPDEVVSAILEEESSEEERKPRKNANCSSLSAFRGTKAFLGIGDKKKQASVEEEPPMPRKRKGSSEQVHLSTFTLKKQKKTTDSEKVVSETEANSEESSSPAVKLPSFKGICVLQELHDSIAQPVPSKTSRMNSMKTCRSSSSESESTKPDCKLPSYLTAKSQPDSFEKRTEGKKQSPVKSSHSVDSCGTVLKVAADFERDARSEKNNLEDNIYRIGASDSVVKENEAYIDVECSLKSKKEPVTFQCRDLSKNVDKQLLDNQKRLAALQQKQKEAEMQKMLIQGALSKVDDRSANKQQHIVFDSDNEDNVVEQKQLSKKVVCAEVKKPLFSESEEELESSGNEEMAKAEESIAKRKSCFEGKVPGKLFQSSSDEISDEDGIDHFKLRPQFEGTAGQKLMELQSRFGADERFRMDDRFLDNDGEENVEEDTMNKTKDDEDLAAEKKKNLDILQSLLHVRVEMPESKKEATKKQFRDVGALHYDPTREDHAVFETKVKESKKQSKAERRKKRQEAEKLPEVSKETYYDVAVDLKEILTSNKNKDEKKEEKVAWDKQEDESVRSSDIDTGNVQNSEPAFGAFSLPDNESSGFKFSFFGIDMDESKESTEIAYKTEILKTAKVPWQEDPRFQDSSSEEDDDDRSEEEQKTEPLTKPEKCISADKINLFFFFKDDERLKEGPKIFCRSSDLEEQRNSWEEKRSSLIEDYRKKHKDAKRKIKSRQ